MSLAPILLFYASHSKDTKQPTSIAKNMFDTIIGYKKLQWIFYERILTGSIDNMIDQY